jgi:hypothetical protein
MEQNHEEKTQRRADYLCGEAEQIWGEGIRGLPGDEHQRTDPLHWKRKYGGMGVGELRRLKQLEDENRKLKSLVADLSLDKHILQEVIAKSFEACAQAGAEFSNSGVV